MHRPFWLRVDKLPHQRIAAVAHLVWRALRGHAAIAQNDDLIGNAKGLVQIV